MPKKNIDKLIELVATLRGENGCPWDQKQTPSSIAVYLVEETFELLDAIESENPEHIMEELGDVFFQVLFIARLFQETGHFDLEDAARGIYEKMIRRHPHVFGDVSADNAEQVKANWQQIKKEEKKNAGKAPQRDVVPSGLPSLVRAHRLSEIAARSEPETLAGAMETAERDFDLLKTGLGESNASDRQKNVTAMFGNLFLSLVHAARLAGVHPETALTGAVRKLEDRLGETGNEQPEYPATIHSIPS